MNPLLKRKTAVDSVLTELDRAENGTVYDRDYQTKGKNPFADKRNQDMSVPVKTGFLQTDMVDGHERHLPPRDKNIRSESTQKELDKEEKKDTEGYLLKPKSGSFDLSKDRNKKIAHKLSSNRVIRQFAAQENIKVDDHSLIVNIPRGKFALLEVTPAHIASMERAISTSLNVRVKYAHTILSSGFDGVSLEFLMV